MKTDNYKIDPKVFVGGKWDTDKVAWHWTNLIQANGPFCNSLFYQIKKTYFPTINKFNLVFPTRQTVTRLGTCYQTRQLVYMYCRSLKVFLHEIVHLIHSGHGPAFMNFQHELLDHIENIIPITKKDKMSIAVELVKRSIDDYWHYDSDQTTLNNIELAAKANDLDPDDLLDAYYY